MNTPARILLVDDEEADRVLIRRLIERARPGAFEVFECSDGEGALAHCTGSEPPDCVLLDHSLAGSDGLELLDALRGEHPLAPVPVVLLTGSGSEMLAVEAMKRGAIDYLTKRELEGDTLTRALSYAVARGQLVARVAEHQEELRDFARTAAHDLRAPINQVYVLSELLRDKLGEDAGEASELADRIRVAVRSLADLIDSLESYAQLGWESYALEEIELEAALVQALDVLGPEIQRCGAHVESDPLPAVRGHLPSLARLFQNLVSNAVKYGADEPPLVRVSAGPVRDGQVEVVLEDNGRGIPADERSRVFDAFYRGAGAQRKKGSGLGLSICRRIVHRHGGRIWIDAAPDTGCTVHFTLPAAGSQPGGGASRVDTAQLRLSGTSRRRARREL